VSRIVNLSKLKQSAFKCMPMTINEYFGYIQDNNVNPNPIWQRADVQSTDRGGVTPSKAQGIVQSIFEGLDIGEISIAGITDKEVLEGGHRTRKAILDFLNNEFPLHKSSFFGEKFFSDLPPYAKEYYRNYKLRIIDFYELDDSGKGKQFVQFATQTVLNFVEKANAYGMAASIVELRELTKVVDYGDGAVDNVLTLFKDYVGFSNNRGKYLELILDSAGLWYGEGLSTNENQILEYLEVATPTKINKIKNSILKEYSFYQNVGAFWNTYTKHKISIMEFGFLRHVYFNLPKDFKVEDYDLFTKSLVKNLNDFEDANSQVDYVDENGDRLDGRYSKVWDAFKSYVKKTNSDASTEQVRIWLSDITPSVIAKDSERAFSVKDLLKRYEEVGGICEITGDPIHFSQAVGAHIIPHSEGGKTTYDNLMITTKFHNSKMGTMNALDYKEQYEASIKE